MFERIVGQRVRALSSHQFGLARIITCCVFVRARGLAWDLIAESRVQIPLVDQEFAYSKGMRGYRG